MIDEVSHVLRSHGELEFATIPCRIGFEGERLEIRGEVPSLAIKRRALRLAAAHPAVSSIEDRLHVTPSCARSDLEIAEHVAEALVEEAALSECAIRMCVDGACELVQRPCHPRGEVCVSVEGCVVTLLGEVPTRAHQRLAGVLAWWVPGTRDVVDELRVSSTDQDNDDEISAAVRAALERDPFVDAAQIRVYTRGHRVTLAGLVWSRAEHRAAEHDAWSVFGVADVSNELRVAESL